MHSIHVICRRGGWGSPLRDGEVWYRAKKEHWLGWLGAYDGPGAYERANWNRSPGFVRIPHPDMSSRS
jgi:hypothetical protein